MKIWLTRTDCEKIVNESLQVGGGKYTEMEIALAKHALELHESLHKAKCERAEANVKYQELFDRVYSIHYTCMKACGPEIMERRKAVLAGLSKAAFEQAVKMDAELKKMA